MSDRDALGAVPPQALSETRRRMHRSVQWLARMARSYLPPSPDDAHTALLWVDAPVSALADDEPESTPHISLSADIPVEIPIVGPALTARYAPRLHQLWLGSPARPNNVFNLTDRPDADQVRDLPMALQSLGADGARMRMDLPYEPPEIPDLGAPPAAETAELCRYYAMFARLLAAPAFEGRNASPTRLWPHHFDLARLITLEGERTIGIGLAPDDAHFDQPYLYISPWPATALRALPTPPSGLRWHTEGFTALVATADEIMLGDGAEARIAEAIAAGIALCEDALAR